MWAAARQKRCFGGRASAAAREHAPNPKVRLPRIVPGGGWSATHSPKAADAWKGFPNPSRLLWQMIQTGLLSWD
ncbi:hypothetical protein NG819_15505 [Pseudarthrobacter sp. Fe7]|nr:hypothetical protein NG819_15505 [Pseudarthrobacter sp. Fe7]